jgi:glycosyltransferase involved in cell wall biosynthesis
MKLVSTDGREGLMLTASRLLSTHATAPRPLRQLLAQKFGRSISLLAWAYNEEALVEPFLDRAVALLEETVADWEIVFVNDGSTDRTGALIDNYAKREQRLRVLHNDRNRNVGYTSRRAIAAARKEFLFWQTVDWSYDINNMRLFLELLLHYDVVQGIRPTPVRLLSYIPVIRSIYRVKTRSDNLRKAIVSLSNYYLLRILFGVHFHDFQNVTFYPTKLLQSIDLAGNSSFVNPECLLRTYEKGARFIEVPIPFIPRSTGVPKGTKFASILKSVRDILSAWLSWGIRFRRQTIGRRNARPIDRVAEPFHLNDKVLEIVLPLLKCYR